MSSGSIGGEAKTAETELTEKITAVEKDIKDTKGELATLKAQLETEADKEGKKLLNERIDRKEALLLVRETRLRELEGDLRSLKQQTLTNGDSQGDAKEDLFSFLRALGQKVDETNQKVDETNQKVDETNQKVDEANQKVDRLEERMLVSDSVKSPVYTPKNWGKDLLTDIKNDEVLSDLDYTGDSVLSADDAKELKNFMESQAKQEGSGPKILEKAMTAWLYHYLSPLFERDGVLFMNSEDYGWLPKEGVVSLKGVVKLNEAAKPDNFWIHKSFCKVEKTTGTGIKKGRPIVHKKVLHMVRTAEAKLTLGVQGLGEECDYICRLLPKVTSRGRGLVYNHTGFWLIEFKPYFLTRRIVGKWTDAGSRAAIIDFFREDPVVIRALRFLCRKLEVTAKPGGFLGAGAFGHVFEVTDKKGKQLALKVVCHAQAVSLLEHERQQLVFAGKAIAVQPVGGVCGPGDQKEENSTRTDAKNEMFAGLLLSCVGEQVKLPDDMPHLVRLLCLLHKKGLTHGDARVANFIRLGDGNFRLIDFLENANESFSSDMSKLLKSAIRGPLSPSVTAALAAYDGTSANVICSAVGNSVSERKSRS